MSSVAKLLLCLAFAASVVQAAAPFPLPATFKIGALSYLTFQEKDHIFTAESSYVCFRPPCPAASKGEWQWDADKKLLTLTRMIAGGKEDGSATYKIEEPKNESPDVVLSLVKDAGLLLDEQPEISLVRLPHVCASY